MLIRSALRTAALALALAYAPQRALADADLAESLSRLDAQIAAAPGDATLRQRRAGVERLGGNLERATADLARAENLGLSPTLVARDRGLLLLAADRTAEAEAMLRTARWRAPRDVTILLPHARSLTKLGRLREAADTYTALIELAPNAGPDVHLERIRALEALGPASYDEALRAADAAIATRGPAPAFEQAAIDVALHAGRMDEAAATYGAALAALESLPPQRRSTPAAAEIETQARAAIVRIATDGESRNASSAVQAAAR